MDLIRSQNFDEEFFREKLIWREGPRLDFKRTWKDDLNIQDKLHKFVRHLIAFANVSYRIGKPCYIFFGVDDKTRNLFDLRNDYPKDPPNFDNQSEKSIAYIMEDHILQEIILEMQQWINPDIPDLQLEFGEVRDNSPLSKLVAWLRIDSANIGPFSLKKSIYPERRGRSYQKGTIFIRKGSNSVILDQSQKDYLVSDHLAPHLPKTKWEAIINKCVSGEFLDATNYTPHLPHRIKDTDEIALDRLLSDISSEEMQKYLIIGSPGSGKSLLIRQLAHAIGRRHDEGSLVRKSFASEDNGYGDGIPYNTDLDEDDFDYTVRDIANELEPTPRALIPVFHTLRTYFSEVQEFELELGRNICQSAMLNDVISIDKFFNIPGSVWLLLLDGLDELHKVDDHGQKLFAWTSRLPPNVKVLLTTRPHVDVNPDNFDRVIEIRDLNFGEIQQLLRQKIISSPNRSSAFDDFIAEELDKYMDYLQDIGEEIEPVLSTHRALDGFAKYFVDTFHNYQIKEDVTIIEPVDKIDWSVEFPEPQINPGIIPFITSEMDQSDDSFLVAPKSDDLSDEEKDYIFSLGIALRYITNYIREENMKRMSLRVNRSSLDDQSRRDIEKCAWLSDWQTPVFSIVKYIEEGVFTNLSLEWNEQLGFIKQINHHRKSFSCNLFQLYSAAEYSCNLLSVDPKLLGNNYAMSKVRTLHIDLMQADGLQPLI